MQVLVTGSSGFIGKRLVQALIEKGILVKEFDIQNRQSVLDRKKLFQEMQNVDIVFHLAAILDEQSPNLFKINVDGTRNVLEAAQANRVKQFIFTSTVGVIGDTLSPADEKTPVNPVTRYEKSKAMAEQIVFLFQETVPVTVIRPAIVVGPNKEWKKIIDAVKKNTPLPCNGLNIWQTISVDDLVDVLMFVAGNEETIGETFIVAEKNPKTLLELVEFIRKKNGLNGKPKTIPVWLARILAFFLEFVSLLTGKKPFFTQEIIERTIRNRHYSIKKINVLGWEPKLAAFDALEKTINELG